MTSGHPTTAPWPPTTTTNTGVGSGDFSHIELNNGLFLNMEYEKAVITTVTLPKSLVRKLDRLVTKGVFPTRADAVRYAVERLLKRYEG
jgi:hypothetical protein